MRIDLKGLTILLISGTASIDEAGNTVHVGDLRAQLRRTFYNITDCISNEVYCFSYCFNYCTHFNPPLSGAPKCTIT